LQEEIIVMKIWTNNSLVIERGDRLIKSNKTLFLSTCRPNLLLLNFRAKWIWTVEVNKIPKSHELLDVGLYASLSPSVLSGTYIDLNGHILRNLNQTF
jgi:hypothetical protein